MSKKTHEVEPFQYTYTVKNIYTNRMLESDTIGEAMWLGLRRLLSTVNKDGFQDEIKRLDKGFTYIFNDSLKRKRWDWISFEEVPGWNGKPYLARCVHKNAAPLVIYNQFGAIIPPDVLGNYKPTAPQVCFTNTWNARKNRYNMQDARRRWTSNNPNKIKFHWSVKETVDNDGDISYDNHLRYFRRIRTAQACRMSEAHCNEYGNEIVRGKRRSKNIRTSWDDISSSMWKTQESWKHHSKRRTQWKTK